jgi:hypothetical protein
MLRDLYSSPNIIRMVKSGMMRWAGHVERTGERREAYVLLVGKPEGNRPLERPRHRSLDSIEKDISKKGWGSMDWIDVAQVGDQWRALVNTVMNLRVP